MKKYVLFVFNGDHMCFIHVLLNALDKSDKGFETRVVIEGSATKLIPELANETSSMNRLWEKTKSRGLIDGVCRACSSKMGTLEAAQVQQLKLLDDMSGHPGMAGYMNKGYEISIF